MVGSNMTCFFFIFTVFVLCENILAKESLYPVYFLVGTMLCATYIFERYLEHCPIIARTFWYTRALSLQATSADIREQQNSLISTLKIIYGFVDFVDHIGND